MIDGFLRVEELLEGDARSPRQVSIACDDSAAVFGHGAPAQRLRWEIERVE
ncbi:hypothetical protein [Microbacterium sp. ZXX196]|uniref:hypothetical protein n=1 Tax=Microbacterium sp. ZXX196 TaxID=2609291 RepID=UPI0012B86F88|nr:hypothetical protein [Microbacterium sp. ZXX196]MTE23209.1 hypothetical protein [Microbacterium sp. ZXX196]